MIENLPENVDAIRMNPAGGLVGGLKTIVNPFGISGQKGIGAAVLVSIYTVTTIAEILADAKITTGEEGDGLTVAATQKLFGVAVGYTGTQATDFGLNVTLIVATYNTTTRAGIGPGVVIRGGPVTVRSNDDIDRYTIAGQLLKTEKIGIGVSIGIVVVERDNLAYIGRADTATAVPTTRVDIEVSGPVSVTATTGGEVVQVVVGGGIALPAPDERTVGGRAAHPAPARPAPAHAPAHRVGRSQRHQEAQQPRDTSSSPTSRRTASISRRSRRTQPAPSRSQRRSRSASRRR